MRKPQAKDKGLAEHTSAVVYKSCNMANALGRRKVCKETQGTISLTEAQELRTLLEKERHMTTQEGNCLDFFAVRFLTDYVDEYLQSKSNSILASGS